MRMSDANASASPVRTAATSATSAASDDALDSSDSARSRRSWRRAKAWPSSFDGAAKRSTSVMRHPCAYMPSIRGRRTTHNGFLYVVLATECRISATASRVDLSPRAHRHHTQHDDHDTERPPQQGRISLRERTGVGTTLKRRIRLFHPNGHRLHRAGDLE